MNRIIKHEFHFSRVFLLFVVSYILIFLLYSFSQNIYDLLTGLIEALSSIVPIFWPLQGIVDLLLPLAVWDSPMYYLLPIPAFFLMYYGTDWIESYFELSEFEKKAFPYVFWIVAIISYYIVLMWYYFNIYQLTLASNAILQQEGISFFTYLYGGTIRGEVFSGLQFDFWQKFTTSPFLVFALASFLGWYMRKFVVEIVDSTIRRPAKESSFKEDGAGLDNMAEQA